MRLQLQDFIAKPATHIVSVGVNCSVAYNLRRYFDFNRAFPFDWWITTGDGIARFLNAPDVTALYQTSNLELTDDGRSVRHRDFGFLFHHEFKRHWDLPGIPIQDGWQDSTEIPKERTAALFEKFLQLNDRGNRIVFARNESPSSLLTASLERLFVNAEWTIIELKSSSTSEDWKGSSVAWDQELSAFGIVLDLGGHRPFGEIESNLDQP